MLGGLHSLAVFTVLINQINQMLISLHVSKRCNVEQRAHLDGTTELEQKLKKIMMMVIKHLKIC